MHLHFYKYQGTGNDFIIIDNRTLQFPKTDFKLITRLCDRKYGIGADGLILLEASTEVDFKMVYYNSDGNEGSMCGNGGRCIVHFAKSHSLINNTCFFEAPDGVHKAILKDNNVVKLKMLDVVDIISFEGYVYVNTGSPHHVAMVTGLDDFNVEKEGAALRYGKYGEEGSNINFVEALNGNNIFAVRTYERGVEGETLSCGTGATAVAVALHNMNITRSNEIAIQTLGGDLRVSFEADKTSYRNVFLEGKATFVFDGVIEI